MIKWLDVLKFASHGNPIPDKRVEKTADEWAEILTPEQFNITRKKGTERPHSSEMCSLFEAGLYACSCCGTPLFDSHVKFESGTGWPSFTQPIQANAIAYYKDGSWGMYRVEVTCSTCDAHLGHVFEDGPKPSGLRYCINALSLNKIKTSTEKATFGGGCFWCTEAIFQQLKGVSSVESGYSGGKTPNPTYREVCGGYTGHAEVVEITYNPAEISYQDLLKIHFATHNPTTPNQQGADKGTQYRSVIFYRNAEEKSIAEAVKMEVETTLGTKVVTEIVPFELFYKAESYHQNYYKENPEQGYCRAIIEPKLKKFKDLFQEKMR